MPLGMYKVSTDQNFFSTPTTVRQYIYPGTLMLWVIKVKSGSWPYCVPKSKDTPASPKFLRFQTHKEASTLRALIREIIFKPCVAFSIDRWPFSDPNSYLMTLSLVISLLSSPNLMNLNCFGTSVWKLPKQSKNYFALDFFWRSEY